MVSFRLLGLPILLLLVILLLSPHNTRTSSAIVIASSVHDEIPVEDVAVEDPVDDVDLDSDTADEDEDEDEDQESQEESKANEPDKPAVIDPEGQENASGYTVPDSSAADFFDAFQNGLSQWINTADPEYNGRFVTGQGAKPTFKGDRAMIIPEKAKRYGISSRLSTFDDMSSKDLLLQYELKLDEGMTCGGAYFKMPTTAFSPDKFDGSTPYSVMFGPDKCGATDKVHFIFQSKNPNTGMMKEHHLTTPPAVANSYDRKTHLYTLFVKADGKFKLLIDGDVKKEGTLLDSFEPPLQPPQEVDDEDDKKPDDWVEEEKIPDSEATKPDDWDEDAPRQIIDEDATKPEGWLDDTPRMIPDPDAKKPAEWDDEQDGEWEVPMIPNKKCMKIGCGEWEKPLKMNPAFKGKWNAPLVDNPKYIGPWKPRKIPNKDYYEVSSPSLLPIKGIGMEIWTMDQGVLIDNVWVGSDYDAAKKFADATWAEKQKVELAKEEKENAEKEKKEKKESKEPKTGAAGGFLDKAEDAIEKLEALLQPVESFLNDVGAGPYLNKLIDLGVQKPMFVVVSVPLLIVSIFLILLSGKGGRSAPSAEVEGSESTAARKKTDEPTEDDAPEEQSEASSVAESAAPESKGPRKRRTATAQ